MADKVKNTPGSIGYVEYQYAVKDNISQAAVLNPSGRFVKASNDEYGGGVQGGRSAAVE